MRPPSSILPQAGPAPSPAAGQPGGAAGVGLTALARLLRLLADVPDLNRLLAAAADLLAAGQLPMPTPPPARRPDSDIVECVAAYIQDHPGSAGKEIAKAVGISENYVYRIAAGKLKQRGVFNVRGSGYHPPPR